jgi:hypothetical protein
MAINLNLEKGTWLWGIAFTIAILYTLTLFFPNIGEFISGLVRGDSVDLHLATPSAGQIGVLPQIIVIFFATYIAFLLLNKLKTGFSKKDYWTVVIIILAIWFANYLGVVPTLSGLFKFLVNPIQTNAAVLQSVIPMP